MCYLKDYIITCLKTFSGEVKIIKILEDFDVNPWKLKRFRDFAGKVLKEQLYSEFGIFDKNTTMHITSWSDTCFQNVQTKCISSVSDCCLLNR